MGFDFLGDEQDDGLLSPPEIEAIRRGESSTPDVEAAEALVDSVSALMVSVATGGPQINTVDAEYKREHRALAAVLKRLDIPCPNRFDDLWRWYGRWSDGSLPQYRDRRAFISELFSPVRKALEEQSDATRELADGVTEGATGWAGVDQQSARLRRLWREAEDADAYNGVGLQCIKILTSLGHVVFDADRDLPADTEEPGRDDAKKRIDLFVRRVAAGEKAESIRKIVNGAYSQANAAKHRHVASRTDAGIAANATLLIVSTLRLLVEEDEGLPPTKVTEIDIPF